MFLAVGRRYLRSLFPLYTKNCARTCCMHYKLQTNKRKENSNTIMLLIFFIKEYWVFEDVLARVFFFRSPFLKCTHHSIPLLLFPQHLPWSKSFFLSFFYLDRLKVWCFDVQIAKMWPTQIGIFFDVPQLCLPILFSIRQNIGSL